MNEDRDGWRWEWMDRYGDGHGEAWVDGDGWIQLNLNVPFVAFTVTNTGQAIF